MIKKKNNKIPKVLVLRCRKCGGHLSGLEIDRVFSCTVCRMSAEVAGGNLVWRNFVGVKAKLTPRNPCYLPFWEFTIDYRIKTTNTRILEAYKKLKKLNKVYIHGYSTNRASLFGDLALHFTVLQPELEYENKGYILGCTHGEDKARTYVKLFVLSYLDRTRDVTNIELDIEEKGVRLIAFPFYDAGDYLIDCVTEKNIPSVAFQDLPLIRANITGNKI